MNSNGPKWLKDKWPGGRKKVGRNGRTIYVLEQRHQGKRYSITLPLTIQNDIAAGAQLSRFLEDPEGYCKKREEVVPRLTAEVIEQFCKEKLEKGICKEHVNNVLKHYLTAWMDFLEAKDFRACKLKDALTWLRKPVKHPKTGKLTPKKGISKRIVALKSWTAWMRQTGELDRHADWTLDLVCPEEKRVKSIEQKTYPLSQVEAIYRHISPWTYRAGTGTRTTDAQSIRDTIRIAATTGLHLKEIDRIAGQRDEAGILVGKIDRLENQPHPIAGYFTVWHKTGHPHNLAVDQATLEAALRLQAKGKAPERSHLHKCLDRASSLAEVKEIEPGSLRHCFVSWSLMVGTEVRVNGKGASELAVTQVASHSMATSRKHYQNTIAPLIVLPLKLEHPDDPKPQELLRAPLKVVG
jgi:site-specific recombinase XerD